MTKQWIRKARLQVIKGDNALDLSDLHFKFTVSQADLQRPQTANIRVYNLSETSENRFIGQEFDRVTLEAGYEDSEGNGYGLIFDGNLLQSRRGRESPTDTFMDIVAAEGDIFFNFASVSQSIAKGGTHDQIIDRVIAEAKTTKGALPDGYTLDLPALKSNALPRGKVLYGLSRDVLHVIAATHGMTYFYDKDGIHFVPLDGFKAGEALEVNATTGLIGWPTQTQDGIELTVLLNSRLEVGGRIRINNESILQALVPTYLSAQSADTNSEEKLPQINNDGLYKVMVIEHDGDTRGQSWYSHIVALSIDEADARLTGLLQKGQF